jgi:hypothetical protein
LNALEYGFLLMTKSISFKYYHHDGKVSV